MSVRDPRDFMWSDALDMVTRAEKLHRQLFQPRSGEGRGPRWEPPVDVIETEREVVIIAALPGVDDKAIEAAIDGNVLVISGERNALPELRTAVIHRLELPQGRFERRVPLPAGRYGKVVRRVLNGCLVVNLLKANGGA
jgi:HSP20 family protein